jgi:hypothetical protein
MLRDECVDLGPFERVDLVLELGELRAQSAFDVLGRDDLAVDFRQRVAGGRGLCPGDRRQREEQRREDGGEQGAPERSAAGAGAPPGARSERAPDPRREASGADYEPPPQGESLNGS